MFVAWFLVRGATKELGGGLEPNENGEGDMVEGGKLFVKIVFQYLVGKKKTGQRKTIFSQRKILIKIRLIFYRLFSKKKKFGKQSLSHSFHLL